MSMDETAVVRRYADASPEARRLIDRILDQDSDDAAWTRQLGPVHRQGDVARLLGKSKQAVSSDRGLLKLRMRSGVVGYPLFQFDGRRPLPGVRAVVMWLDGVVATSWTTASWLTSPSVELGGVTPVAALRDGQVDRVNAAARRFAHAAA
jgi:hypothetical protein